MWLTVDMRYNFHSWNILLEESEAWALETMGTVDNKISTNWHDMRITSIVELP